MTSGVAKMQYPAMTLNEAILTATDRWRVLVEDPEATLPWSTHFEFFELVEPKVEDGRMVDGESKSMVGVTIEFDRKIVDELTGVHTAQST